MNNAEIIESILKNSGGELKTEEIVSRYCNKIGRESDISMQRLVANQLIRLEKKNKVTHVRHSFWCYKQG